jgi:peptidoglycan hydrolase CwlO-like protein
VITTKELQNIKDDLDKLDLEANYLNDEIKSLDFDIETLNNAVGLIVA